MGRDGQTHFAIGTRPSLTRLVWVLLDLSKYLGIGCGCPCLPILYGLCTGITQPNLCFCFYFYFLIKNKPYFSLFYWNQKSLKIKIKKPLPIKDFIINYLLIPLIGCWLYYNLLPWLNLWGARILCKATTPRVIPWLRRTTSVPRRPRPWILGSRH